MVMVRLGLIALVGALTASSVRPFADPMPETPKPTTEPGVDVEVLFADDSLVKLRLLDEIIGFDTPYGALKIPLRDVRKIEIGQRISDADNRQIAEAIAELMSTDPKKREAGRAALMKIGPKASHALARAAKLASTDAKAHAVAVLDRLKPDANGPEPLPEHDVIVTDTSRMAGRLTASTAKVMTFQFGEKMLKLTDVRTVRSLAAEPDEKPIGEVLAGPNNLMAYQGQFGTTVNLRVTGVGTGGVWGTGTYTLDSYLASAVVHAGQLKAGQTGVVRVRIVQSPVGFVGSFQNGITSSQYNFFQAGAYEFIGKAR